MNAQHNGWPNVWTDRDSRARRVDFRAAMAANLGSHWTKWEAEVRHLQPLVALFATERTEK